jgi:benzoylformate decarboxylase
MTRIFTMQNPQSQAAQVNSATTVRSAAFAFMRAVGVNTIFGNPGSTELPMFRDFPNDFRYVLGLQEASVVGMADGFAQATGNAAFVNLHSAAGVGNAMGNIFTAFKNQTPMVITAGQQARSLLLQDPYLHSNQATELPKPYVKWSIEPSRAEDVPAAIARAYYLAMQQPRGPVLVSIPADDWDRPAPHIAVRTVSTETAPQPEMMQLVCAKLDAAGHPALIIGAEVDRAGAWNAVVRLAEKHQAGVYVAPLAGRRGFPEDHPLFMGFLPAVPEQIVRQLAGHDLILVIGAPAFTYHVEGAGPHIPEGATLCVLSNDPEVVARAPSGIAVQGSVRLSTEVLLAGTAQHKRPALKTRVLAKRVEAAAPITVAYLLQTLAEVRSPEDVIVEEAPTARVVMNERLPIVRSGTFFTMDSGGLGFGLPAAVGIALAQPDKRVICVIGDGSSLYSIQAIWTAVQFQLPVTFIVINNQKYAALKRFAGVFGFPQNAEIAGTDLPSLDIGGFAKAQDCDAIRIDSAMELRSALEQALHRRGPGLVEVMAPWPE